MSICHGVQVEKSGLITGSRLGADNEYEFDELEVSPFSQFPRHCEGRAGKMQGDAALCCCSTEQCCLWQRRLGELGCKVLERSGTVAPGVNGALANGRRCIVCCSTEQCWLGQGRLEELERELLEVNGNAERLARSFSELVELQLVLEKASAFFDDAQHRASTATFQAQPADTGSEPPTLALSDHWDLSLDPTTEQSRIAAGARQSLHAPPFLGRLGVAIRIV